LGCRSVERKGVFVGVEVEGEKFWGGGGRSVVVFFD